MGTIDQRGQEGFLRGFEEGRAGCGVETVGSETSEEEVAMHQVWSGEGLHWDGDLGSGVEEESGFFWKQNGGFWVLWM